MSADSLAGLHERLRAFAKVRDWEQFHSPKNLSMALAGEAGELIEIFQWLTEQQSAALSPQQRVAVEQELADVLLYLVRLADRLNVDLIAAAARKMEINERKYPADVVRGRADKR
jgi:NTP pyrophosphatase (non-canonical NTP hydrolase)